MTRSGISQKTVIGPVLPCSGGTTHAGTKILNKISSLVPESISFCEPTTETLSLFGELPNTGRTAKRALNVRSSETKADTSHQSLSVRLTRSLITAGLVKGITPLSVRATSGLAIRDFAFLPLDGGDAGAPQKVCSSLRGCRDGAQSTTPEAKP